jgi:hypothetical protein
MVGHWAIALNQTAALLGVTVSVFNFCPQMTPNFPDYFYEYYKIIFLKICLAFNGWRENWVK